ncbi:hypothetical protein SY83_03435 [Paenibacillus swuensis]|uniref:N-acetyltransferase domain-containing protein n=1 Tax=Paenibacillus swuensis TaxID=1178515 RepID=A0A172TEQ8_9BACL|nr:GNAT family N-acetyltransferase [Paenibacillus swuensis]ANE45521.1 hypothetical protein SY83_03435 [Paenibacillus swuensis]
MYEAVLPMQKHHHRLAGDTLTEAFKDSPMFVHLFPEPVKRRKVLSMVFPIMIQMLHAVGTVYVSSDEVEGIICVRKAGTIRARNSLPLLALKLLVRLPRVFLQVSPIQFHMKAKELKELSSALDPYYKHHRNFLVLDAVAVHPRYQGQGKISPLIHSALQEARESGTFCVLQTETEFNASLYEHFGFKRVRTFPCINGAFNTYVLLYDPHGIVQS